MGQPASEVSHIGVPLADEAPSSWAEYPLTMGVIAIVELAIGVGFLLARVRRVAAIAMTGLGVAFVLFTWLQEATWSGKVPCRCLGPYQLTFMQHLGLATLVACMGAVSMMTLGKRSEKEAKPGEGEEKSAQASE